MNEKIKAFLDARKEEENKKEAEERKKVLIELGLFEKVYSELDHQSDDFPFCEWDYKNSLNKYYKKVPFEITDEEYEKIKKYAKQSEEKDVSKGKNTIATILTVIAVIVYIAGFVLSFIFGVDKWGDINGTIIIWWIAAFITGTAYLGFAEIIKLLTEIKNK